MAKENNITKAHVVKKTFSLRMNAYAISPITRETRNGPAENPKIIPSFSSSSTSDQ
jgi:hypothetical protein